MPPAEGIPLIMYLTILENSMGSVWANMMSLVEKSMQYTTEKVIKGSVLADHLAHQVVDDYQSMFEVPNESIMLVTDCEKPGPYDGPKQGSRWTVVFGGASNALGNGRCSDYLP